MSNPSTLRAGDRSRPSQRGERAAVRSVSDAGERNSRRGGPKLIPPFCFRPTSSQSESSALRTFSKCSAHSARLRASLEWLKSTRSRLETASTSPRRCSSPSLLRFQGLTTRREQGDTVTMHYVGTLLSTGAGFDSSRTRGVRPSLLSSLFPAHPSRGVVSFRHPDRRRTSYQGLG